MPVIDRPARGWRSRLLRPTHPVNAVTDEDLWKILDELGLLAALDAGELRCFNTGVVLTRENVGGILMTTAGPKLIADPSLPDPEM